MYLMNVVLGEPNTRSKFWSTTNFKRVLRFGVYLEIWTFGEFFFEFWVSGWGFAGVDFELLLGFMFFNVSSPDFEFRKWCWGEDFWIWPELSLDFDDASGKKWFWRVVDL